MCLNVENSSHSRLSNAQEAAPEPPLLAVACMPPFPHKTQIYN